MRKIGAVALVILTMVACGSQENVDTTDIQQDHPAPTSGIDLSQSTSTREVDSVTENTSNITSICENEYFPVVLGAYWVYDVKYEQADGSSYRLYLRHEVVEVNPDTFYVHDQNLSFTPEFEPLPSQLSHEEKIRSVKWFCTSEGLLEAGGGNPISGDGISLPQRYVVIAIMEISLHGIISDICVHWN